MTLLKFYEFTDEPVISRQETVRMAALPKVTKRLPVVAQETTLGQQAALIERHPVGSTRNTPLPDVLATAHKPVYRVYIDGKKQPDLCDLDGVDLLVGRACRYGARYIEVYKDEHRMFEVRNGSEATR